MNLSMTDKNNIVIGKISISKKMLVIIVSVLLPVIIMLSILYAQGIFPFGTKTTMYVDLRGQYTEFLSSLRYAFDGDNSLLFSWSRSMGGNAIGLYSYYTGGVLAFISCLFPVSKIYIAVILIQIFQVALCGLTMSIYLEYGLMKNGRHIFVIMFSVAYALMSYNIVYLGCYMWLTGCVFMPLVMLGIEKMLDGRKGFVFYIFLSLAMLSNYYTAYMICLFSVLFLIVRLSDKYSWKKADRTSSFGAAGVVVARYIGMGALSALTAMPVILPVYKDLMSGKLADTKGAVKGVNFEFFDIFKKFLPGQYDTIKDQGGLPSIYVGLVVLALSVVFFIQIKRKISEKITSFLVICIIFISLYFKLPDTIWHGFQMPNSFPYRYAFILSFFMTFLAARAIDIIEISKNSLVRGCSLCLLFVTVCDMRFNANYITRRLDEEFLYTDISEYSEFYDETAPLVKQIKSSDNSWYRVEKDYEFSKNDSMLLGYNGMTHYSSTYNTFVNSITYSLGLAQSWIWNSGYGATPMVDSLFGVKYRLAKSSVYPSYEKTGDNKSVSLYKNPYAFGPCFVGNKKAVDVDCNDQDFFNNQNSVMSAMMGTEKEYFTHLEYERTDEAGCVTLTVPNNSGKSLYLYIWPNGGRWGEIYVNDEFVSNYFSTETTHVVYLGKFFEGQPVNIKVRSEDAVVGYASIAELNDDELNKDLQQVANGSIGIDSYGAGSIHGKINVGADQVVLTSIPFDEGYTVLVDGNEVYKSKWLDTFMVFEANPGVHEIDISYTPPGFKSGMIASAFAIIVMLAYMLIPVGKKKTDKDVVNNG